MTKQKSKISIRFLILNYNFAFCILNFKLFQLLIFIFIILLFPRITIAQAQNNKFGIHLAQPQTEDIEAAAKLVNANGGDWGYVTLVIQENDQKKEKWQEIFNQLRRLHLIPIIRLATKPEGSTWRRPTVEEIDQWVKFLDSLNWVVKNRYIVLFNEPNHGNEWGGAVDVESYAKIALTFALKLKEKNPDFLVMLAGFDASAPSLPPKFEDEEVFLTKFANENLVVSELTSSEGLNLVEGFNKGVFSGWVSHSYPNPDFSGSPLVFGRGTTRTYQWELDLLRRLGVERELPVFITETGWKRQVQSSKFKVQSYLDEATVADHFKTAYENVWLPDEQVWAVTPFVLNYQGEPFLEFSWQKEKSSDFYQQYYTVQSMIKIKGKPAQMEKGEINFVLPQKLLSQSSYQFSLQLKNEGQGYWDKSGGYELEVRSYEEEEIDYLFSDIKDFKPFEEKKLIFSINTGRQLGEKRWRFILKKDEEKILESKDWRVELLPLPSLILKVNLFPKLNDKGKDFEIQVFDKNQTMVFRQKNQEIFGGNGFLKDIRNVVVGEKYRVVILKPYYLPRQSFIVFQEKENKVGFRPLVPVDFNLDGKFSLVDLITLIKKPSLLKMFFP